MTNPEKLARIRSRCAHEILITKSTKAFAEGDITASLLVSALKSTIAAIDTMDEIEDCASDRLESAILAAWPDDLP